MLVQALQNVGEEKLIDLALREEYDKGASEVSLMLKYGVTRNGLHQIITGASRPRGSQYRQTVKKEMKDKPATRKKKEIQVKTKTSSGSQDRKVRRRYSINKTKPRSFSGLPNLPKAKYTRKACRHECCQSY